MLTLYKVRILSSSVQHVEGQNQRVLTCPLTPSSNTKGFLVIRFIYETFISFKKSLASKKYNCPLNMVNAGYILDIIIVCLNWHASKVQRANVHESVSGAFTRLQQFLYNSKTYPTLPLPCNAFNPTFMDISKIDACIEIPIPVH